MARAASRPIDLSLIKYVAYHVVLQFTGKLEGGIPKDPEVIKKWLETKGVSLADTYQESAAKLLPTNGNAPSEEEIRAELEEVTSKAWCGFLKDDEGNLVIEARQIGAAFKEAANVMRPILDVTAFKNRVAERLWVSSLDSDSHELIRLKNKEGKYYREPTGNYERPVHALTRVGPISALKRTDYVGTPIIEFQVEVLDDGLLTDQVLEALLEYMKRNGIGANRSQYAGKFEVIAFERADKPAEVAAAS